MRHSFHTSSRPVGWVHYTLHLCNSSGSHKSKQDNRQQTHKKMDTAFAQPDIRFPGTWLLQGNCKVSPNWYNRWLLCDRLALALLHTSSGLLRIGCCTKMRESYTVHPDTTPASHNLTPHSHYHSGIVWGSRSLHKVLSGNSALQDK